MKIDELLDKYFEGETSCEEERELRRFFTEKEVPEHLQTYRPLFAYLNREATSMAEPTEEKSVTTESAKEVPAQRKPSRLYRTFYAVSGIAAGLLLLLGVAKIIFPLSSSTASGIQTRNWWKPKHWKPCRMPASRMKI